MTIWITPKWKTGVNIDWESIFSNIFLSQISNLIRNLSGFEFTWLKALVSIKKVLELINSIPELEEEFELKYFEQDAFNWI